MPFNPLYCKWGCFSISQRIVLAIVAHLATQNQYNLRAVLNVAINEMLERETVNKTTKLACPNLPITVEDIEGGTYPWKPNVEALVKYAFFIGYFLGHFPGGWLSDKIGARWVLQASMFLSAVVTVILPFGLHVSNGHFAMAVVLRGLLGLFQGPGVPAISTLVSNWVPKEQRALLGALAFGGAYLGQVLGSALTGVIVHHFQYWPSAFYFWSFITLLWCILCLFTVFSYPSTHPFITEEEKAYLEQKIKRKLKFKVPWKKVAMCLPVWAILFGHFGHGYVIFVMSTDLPKYMKDILNMDVRSYGTYSALPFLGAWVSAIFCGWLSDYIIGHTSIRTITMRKVYTVISNVVPALCNLLAVYVGCSREWAVILYAISLICIGPSVPGLKINVNDLTVNYGGMIMAVINGFSALAGVLGLAITGLLSKERTLGEWRMIMWIMLGVGMTTATIYVILAKSERQEWDILEDDD